MRSFPSFALLLICFIAVAQQAVNFPSNALPWMAPYYPSNSYHSYPLFYHGRFGFNPAFDHRERHHLSTKPDEISESRSRYRPYQMDDEATDVMADDGYFQRTRQSDNQAIYSGSGNINVYPLDYERKWAPSNPLGRFLGSGINLGSGGSAHYLLKTSFVFVTSRATLCFATSCIPAALFVPLSSNVICARKKREDDLIDGIAPSTTEKVIPTASLTLGEIKFDEHPIGISSSPVLLSSLGEPQDGDVFNSHRVTRNENERNKRFLFLLTTTITTYSFATSTYTSTISPAAAGALTCRPSGIALC